jgi:hypothetical protein
MVLIMGIALVIVVMATSCGFLMLKNKLRKQRRARMARYAAVFDAGSIPECLEAFGRVVEYLTKEEGQKKSFFVKKTLTALPPTFEERYRRFHFHFIPKAKTGRVNTAMLISFLPVLLLYPLMNLATSIGGSGSGYISLVAWLITGTVMAFALNILFRRFLLPDMVEEMKVLKALDSKVMLAARGNFTARYPVPIKPQDIYADETEKTLSSDVSPWIAAVVIGMVLLLVASIFVYAFYFWKVFEVGLLPSYEYLNHQPYTAVEILLKRRDPEEKLHNLFVEETSGSHLVASSFKPPSDCVFCELPETKDVTEVEAFIQDNWDELIAAVSSLEMKANTIKALPLDCGYVAVQISGKGPDIINGKTGTMEQVIFKRKKTCYRIVIMDGSSGDLASEVRDVAVKTRFK